MANPIDHAHGTQTAVINTEHSLTTATVAGTFQIVVDISAMVAGDILELRAKRKVLTSGTEVSEDLTILVDAPATDDKVVEGEFYPNLNTDAASLEWTLKQTAGTGRAFPWQVFKYT